MLPINEIVLGDAIEVMRRLPDNCIDAVISDPPYGTTALKWDKAIDWDAFWQEARRICSKETSVCALFSAQPFTTNLINSNRQCFRYEVIWEKTIAAGFLDANRRPLRAHENILIFVQKFAGSVYNPQKTSGKSYSAKCSGASSGHYGDTRRVGTENKGDRYPRSVFHYPTVQKQGHPTVKPLELVKQLVLTYSNPGDIILDPFMGSGTTVIACLQTFRRYIGVEKQPEYIELAKKRISEAGIVRVCQTSLTLQRTTN